MITTSAEDPAKIAQFFNYGYTEEGHLLCNFGIEGESYELVDGEPIFTEKVLNNPDGLTAKQALSEYMMAWDNGPFVQDKDYLLQYYTEDAQKEALEKSAYSDADKYVLPRITISADCTNEYSSLTSELQTYRGVGRLQEIVQNALDEFNAR